MDTSDTPQFVQPQDVARHLEAGATFVDAFDRQLKELFFIETPAYIGTDKAEAYASPDFAAYVAKKQDAYVHVFFPWNNHLVKTVNKDDFLRLKTNRNQDLITAEEQQRLRDYRVAVFGLSVGSNVVLVLAQAGIANALTIADFDELDTTNLNRILAGVHEIGLNKATIAARHIYEGNPFAEVRAFTDGISAERLEQLLEAKELDCIVDEVDDMPFKIHCRLLAIKHRVPVVMVTDNGDGIVLHVERYDLGHDKIFGKEPSYFIEKLTQPLTKELAGGIIMNDIVGGVENVDPRMILSVKRVLAKELVSWSQLGSAALLGGVIATVAIKDIVLGRDETPDVRAHIFPHEIKRGSHAV